MRLVWGLCCHSLNFSTRAGPLTCPAQVSEGTWCSGITPAQHAGSPGFNPRCVHFSGACLCPFWLELAPQQLPSTRHGTKNAPAGNQTGVASMAQMHSTTGRLMLLHPALRQLVLRRLFMSSWAVDGGARVPVASGPVAASSGQGCSRQPRPAGTTEGLGDIKVQRRI